MLINSVHPSKVLLLIVAAGLVWVGLIFLAFVILSGITFSTTWIAAGSVFFAAMAWILVMFREIKDSVKLPTHRALDRDLNKDFKPSNESASAAIH